jgi:hypothetical protein
MEIRFGSPWVLGPALSEGADPLEDHIYAYQQPTLLVHGVRSASKKMPDTNTKATVSK